MEKRYQVFVSSTYEDLQEERREIMNALLELDAMPAGMELFPAANEDQWTLIKRVIDDCDYYLVVIAGRYGSVGSDGVGYTEKEYRYALEQKKPILAFLHKDPGSLLARKVEKTAEGKQLLDEFRALAQQKMCKYWSTPTELGSVVSRSLVRLMKTNPAVGWVRADALPDKETSVELLELRTTVDKLRAELVAATLEAPQDADQFAQADEVHSLRYSFTAWSNTPYRASSWTGHAPLTWNEIFSAVSPLLIDEASEPQMLAAINRLVSSQEPARLRGNPDLKDKGYRDFVIDGDAFQTVKIQLRALGLITKSTRKHSVHDSDTYWSLTPFGDAQMVKLRAIRRIPPKPVKRPKSPTARRSKKTDNS